MKKRLVCGAVFLIILVIEVLIALFVRDRFIRPYLGDVLAVMCVYFAARIVFVKKPGLLSIWVTAFAFIVEFIQLTPLSEMLGKGSVLSIIVGGTFDISDLFCYLIGGSACLCFDLKIFSEKN